MDMYEKKEYFVRTSLKSLLFDVDKDILDVYYKYQNDEEYVVIEFIKKDKIKVCVTGDSLLSITKDVLKAL
jgi:hypothetical protein